MRQGHEDAGKTPSAAETLSPFHIPRDFSFNFKIKLISSVISKLKSALI
jgi:hypothetical protein